MVIVQQRGLAQGNRVSSLASTVRLAGKPLPKSLFLNEHPLRGIRGTDIAET
jgi:hypothetical protein